MMQQINCKFQGKPVTYEDIISKVNRLNSARIPYLVAVVVDAGLILCNKNFIFQDENFSKCFVFLKPQW